MESMDKGVFQIAAIQSAFAGTVEENINKMNDLAMKAKWRYPALRLIVFPELTTTGYTLSNSLKEAAEVRNGRQFQRAAAIAKETDVYLVYGYVEKGEEGEIYNSVQLIAPSGESVANYRKIHLTPLERDLFTAGSEMVTAETELGNIGLMICWDMAFPELARILALQGADIIVAPTAWEAPYDASYQAFSMARALDNTVYLAACNHIGETDQFQFFGKTAIYGPDGGLLAAAASKDPSIITAEIDGRQRKELRESFFTMLDERRTDIY